MQYEYVTCPTVPYCEWDGKTMCLCAGHEAEQPAGERARRAEDLGLRSVARVRAERHAAHVSGGDALVPRA